MPVAIAAAPVWSERRRRVGELRRRQAFARQLLDFYAALLAVQEEAFLHAAADAPPSQSLAAYVAEAVMPRVVDVTVAAGPDRLRGDLMRRLDADDPGQMVRRWMRGEDQLPVDRYLARASLGPVLEALDISARAACEGPRDARHCPDCGGPPQLSFFAAASDDLATGPRNLLCARCGATWSYARMTCAGCGESARSEPAIFSEHGTMSGDRGSVVRGLPGPPAADPQRAFFPHMPIEACESCRRDLLKIHVPADPNAVPGVDQIAAHPPDPHAPQPGLSRTMTKLTGLCR